MAKGYLSDYLTPATVAACAAAETAPPARYVNAADLLPTFAGAGPERDDVAALARVMLADVLAAMPTATAQSLANVATFRARRAVGDMALRQTGGHAEFAAGDTLADLAADDASPRASVARGGYGAPDAIARWTLADTLATAVRMAAQADADAPVIVDAMRHAGTTSAVARALDLPTGGRGASALSARVAAVLADVARQAATVVDVLADPSAGPDHARSIPRDPTVPTSGTASAVVLTRANGDRWACLPTVSVRVDSDGVALTLATVDTLPPYVGGTRRETDSADVLAAQETARTRPARRPQGVSVGMVHGGARHVAGDTAPEMRPTGSRKRKRDGGIGSPMIPA